MRARLAGAARRRAGARADARASSRRSSCGYRERVTDTHLPHIARAAARAARRCSPTPRRARSRPASTASSCTTRTPTRWRRSCRRPNTRDDGYGGSARRTRAPAARGVRRACARASAPTYAVGCRYLGDECIEGGNRRRRRGLVRRRVRARRARLPVALEGRQVRGREAAEGRRGGLPVHRAERLRVHADVSTPTRAARSGATSPLAARDPRGGARGRSHDAGRRGRRHPRLRAGRGAARARRGRHRRVARQTLADPDWFRKMRARPRRRGPPLRVHELLRGARPAAQAGHLQAVGSRRARRARRPLARPTASAGCCRRAGAARRAQSSSSRIVSVAVPGVPSVAPPCGDDSETPIVSLPSTVVSLARLMTICALA